MAEPEYPLRLEYYTGESKAASDEEALRQLEWFNTDADIDCRVFDAKERPVRLVVEASAVSCLEVYSEPPAHYTDPNWRERAEQAAVRAHRALRRTCLRGLGILLVLLLLFIAANWYVSTLVRR
jgi:hypothetical protein